jgi:CheY-like chemotaxis protein
VKRGGHDRVVDILLIEDNPGDVRLTKEALKEGTLRNRLHIVQDGQSALAFLRQEDGFTETPRPDLILLDLNLPLMGGQEVLTEIKRDEALKSIPVVILTTSEAQEDIEHAYALHANCYVTKPVDLDQFIRIIRSIESFWFSIAQLPV